ncbi:sorbitol-6-phosphate dehydrogenase [Enterobacter hormaechei]|uniref:Sorbitol-6-phosphate dehydrogenase n=6 Tax=Bacteria TaxID=2 RepID=A0A927HP53_9ENTR|nr:sorbitol-6-phosphate dehydrogenase [Enterobacter hormaechei]MBD3707295.1 sorbitol-6-phosphate dehydrogenase [Enterobacter hormaechei]MBD3716735.1 sorbitol-6-phosphate dehydrogenase [Enterobacter hormaechei]
MTVIYQTTITRIGQSAADALSDQMLITFREGAPADIEEFCFIHCHGELNGELKAGSQLQLGEARYAVTAVGDVAEQNLRELGHITLRFDGQPQAEYPGTVHVVGPVPQAVTPRLHVKIYFVIKERHMSQVAVVIGGGQTLGEFLCHGLAAEGYRVAVVDIQSEKAARVADAINTEFGEGMAYGFGADATSEQSVMALARGVDEIFGHIDLLVYSAGIAKAAFISDFELGDFDRSLQVNLVGYFLCAREFSRLMIRDGIQGRIIQINSKSGKVGSKHNSGYSAAKFGGVGLTQSLALDLAEYGITVHALMLGNLLKSPMFQSLLPQYAAKLGIKAEEVEQYYIDKVPLKRGCDYQDVLNMLLFYASPKASYCTGQSINVTGGQVMF